MHKTEFNHWLIERNVLESVRNDLHLAISHVDSDSVLGRMMDGYVEIVEYTDHAIFEMSPFDAGFIVFGSCMNGDPIAIDIREKIGRIVYLAHEAIDEHGFPSQEVAPSMDRFLQLAQKNKIPLDYYEAISAEGEGPSTT